jgi:hypothetical protein
MGKTTNIHTHVSIDRQLFEHLLDAASARVGSLYPARVATSRSLPPAAHVDDHTRMTRLTQQLGDVARFVGQREAQPVHQLDAALWVLGVEIQQWREALGHCGRASR